MSVPPPDAAPTPSSGPEESVDADQTAATPSTASEIETEHNPDRSRQITVTLAEFFCVIGTFVGIGALGGTRVQNAADGALSATATYIAPASAAFSIWTPIYVGLLAYTIWQWLPGQASQERHRSVGWLIAATMLLNALWLLVVRGSWLWVSVAIILVLAVTLGLTVKRLERIQPTNKLDLIITDGTLGLYLGWVSVAACANVASAFVAEGVALQRPLVEIVSSLVLAVAAALGILFARTLGSRIAIAVAMAWGLGWIAYGRWAAGPISALVSLVAAVAAIVVVVAVFRRPTKGTARPLSSIFQRRSS